MIIKVLGSYGYIFSLFTSPIDKIRKLSRIKIEVILRIIE